MISLITVNTNTTHIIYFCTILLCCCWHTRSAKFDSITKGISLKIFDDYLESPNKKFQMGFFQTEDTTEVIRRYVGIWYSRDPKTIVWVANRDKPVFNSTGFLTVSDDGNAAVLDEEKNVYFNTTVEGASQTALMLLDSGNVVLKNVISGNILWQSFDNPTDTFLPGMTMAGIGLTLTSWRSPEDPGPGNFEFHADPLTNRFYILNGSTTYHWKSGNMSTNSFDENQIFLNAFLLLSNTFIKQRVVILSNRTANTYQRGNLGKVTNPYVRRANPYQGGKVTNPYDCGCRSVTNENYSMIENYTRLVMNYSGNVQYFSWPQKEEKWVLDWQEPKDACSVYRACGPFGICNPQNDSLPCSCMPGFEPISSDDFKAGCRRTSEICQRNTKDTFINRSMISIDDTTLPLYPSMNESDCIKKCLEDCQCQAYSYSSYSSRDKGWDKGRDATQDCSFWNSAPDNLKLYGQHNISFRVSESKGLSIGTPSKDPGLSIGTPSKEPERKSKSHKGVFVVAIVISALVLLSSFSGIGYFAYKRLVNRSRKNQQKHINDVLRLDSSKEEDTEGIDVPYFELETLIAATNDFSEENLLGQGGFGPVYKGKLPGGQEIAVKRLASLTGQGLQEFKNEVILIAKLQHRNLVRLLGYSIRGEEKMLLYEYLPNRSLDLFIFDQTLCISLDWEMRFNIIMGIARGLNYLHHDSRLRIIHRDLKTSNILLDEDMNPKISDFGLAKIIKGKDIEATTNRVVGTYGYMSPEYALDGLFSIKSDVFSFGVVLLEILSGKRNTGFYQSQKRTSLLGYAWNLWIEDRPLELIDQKLMESRDSSELVLKCIIIGLMCVQEDPNDRPTMTNVMGMLGGDITTLPTPKEPAFITRKEHAISSSSSSSKPDMQTGNMLTITELDGR